ncbi:MAG: tRNA lysidine(34) synthetase TilS [Verrucomicrobia bacterium]|nr:tRNA lysidine(34) synthetase TilS [Verrucomicrobiota bacterium]
MNLPEQFAATVRARKLLPRGARLLVAVSGGVDSMALLHLLHALAPAHGWRLTAAHFNHQLRGRSSDADERLVRVTAKKLSVPFVARRADVRRFAVAKKISIEMAARELRHGFLARTAQARKCSAVVLAHHADDQVELFFLRLLRGSGGEGLAGMKWHSPSPADAKVRLIRPLLDVAKADLERFARESKISFREDASNTSPDFLRNRIRGELLPLLRKNYQPALTRMVLRAMEIVGAEAEAVAAAARSANRNFARLPVAVQRRRLQQQLLAQGIAPEFELIESLRGAAGRAVTVSPGVRVSRDAAGVVRVAKAARVGAKKTSAAQAIDLRAAGGAVFAGAKISWRVEQQKTFTRPQPVTGREIFDADKVGAQIALRHWRAGDRFQPIGMAAAVKLQDLFVNAKIPRARRHGLIVATTVGGEIFWVEGLRLGERFKLDAATRRRLRWAWRR